MSEVKSETSGGGSGSGASGVKNEKKKQQKPQQQQQDKKNPKGEEGRTGGGGGGKEHKGKGGNVNDQASVASSAPSSVSNLSTSTNKRNLPGGGGGGGGGGSASSQPLLPPRLVLFDHLPKPRDISTHYSTIRTDPDVHPSIEKFGLLSTNNLFHSDDDRAIAFLMTIIEVIDSYTTPQSVALKNDLLRYIKYQINYLVQHSRVHSMGMGNIIKYIYYLISKLPLELSEADSKKLLLFEIQNFYDEKILLAQQSICNYFLENMIKDQEVIVTYGSSPLIRSMLLSLVHQKKSIKAIRIIIIDSMPQWNGLQTLQTLQSASESCDHPHPSSPHHHEIDHPNHISYVYAPLSGAANAIKDATRVILGASGLLSNGSVFAQAGTGMIACLAHYYRIPVIFAAESYKFTDKVQMDSIIYNELSDPLQLMKLSPPPPPPPSLSSSQQSSQSATSKHAIYLPRDRHEYLHGSTSQYDSTVSVEEMENLLPPRLQLLNLNYDLTPISNVSAILTEVGLIPPTSIPVLLRELKYDVNA